MKFKKVIQIIQVASPPPSIYLVYRNDPDPDLVLDVDVFLSCHISQISSLKWLLSPLIFFFIFFVFLFVFNVIIIIVIILSIEKELYKDRHV